MLKNEKSSGYKKTKVGWIPDDWKCVPLGQVFKKRTARGKRGVPVFSVTQDRGMVLRATLDRKTGNDVSADKSLLVEPGDVAYNMMRMWQGAVAVCEERCVISPAYVVCRPNAGQVDSNFMFSYFKSKAGMHKLFAYSYGVTADRLRLYYEDFSRVPAPLPSIPEQIAITKVLECWDRAIQTLTIKIEKMRLTYKGLSQKLLSGQTRLPGFSKDWKTVKLGSAFNRIVGGGTPSKNEPLYWKNGNIPWASVKDFSGHRLKKTQDYITPAGLKNSASNLIPKNTLLIATRMAVGKCLLTEIDTSINQDLKAVFLKDSMDTMFIFYLLTSLESHFDRIGTGSTVKGISLATLQNASCHFPPLKEQRAIAAVLSASDGKIEALERKLELFKDQKKYLLNNLITGTIRLPQFCKAARKGDRHE